MYSECASLTDGIQEREFPKIVLHSYPPSVGRDVVRSILCPLVELLKSRGEPSEGDIVPPSPLQTREEVEWTMEVVGYGLSLPLAYSDLITSCIDVYEDWLTALSTPRQSVPTPIIADPGYYAQIIFNHFYQLFIPRTKFPELSVAPSSSSTDPHQSQFSLCRRVLQITHSILMKPCDKLSQGTWEAISKHLLTVADVLLSPPLDLYHSNLAFLLSSQLIHVLFEAWLRACTTFFPAPHLWKSLRELCLRWRHHHCLAQQWSKLIYSLTLQVVRHLYSPHYLDHLQGKLEEDVDYALILQAAPSDSLVQCWFRMLHTLGNPVELSYAATFTSLPAFQKTATESGDQLSALAPDLPLIFHEAMRGLARLVFLFLGQELSEGSTPYTLLPTRHSPHGLRRRDSRENREKGNVSVGSGKLPSVCSSGTAAHTPLHAPFRWCHSAAEAQCHVVRPLSKDPSVVRVSAYPPHSSPPHRY